MSLKDDLGYWKKIPVLVDPPVSNDTEFDFESSKDYHIEKVFVELIFYIGTELTQSLPNNIQEQCKKYGFKHRIVGRIHGSMVNTLTKMTKKH